METILNSLNSFASGVGPFFLLLGLLIFVHELGHFAVAKFFKVRVEVFSLGFGKKILQYRKGDTNYCLSLIPLGGYVKMFGDDPSAVISDEDKAHSFLHKPVGQRVAVVLAGPLMNLFFACLLFILIAIVGEEVTSSKIGDIQPATAAYDAGFRSGDKILAVGGEEVQTWAQVQELIQSSANKTLNFKVAREADATEAEIAVQPKLGDNENILSTSSKVGEIPGLALESLSSLLGIASPDSMAAKAGLQPLDLLLKVNGKDVNFFREVEPTLQKEVVPGSKLELEVQAYNSEGKQLPKRTVTLDIPADFEKTDAVAASLGIESAGLYLFKVKPDSPAGKAGLVTGDRIVSVDGATLKEWPELIEKVKNYNPSQRGMEFTYLHEGKTKSSTIVPELTELMTAKGQEEKRYTVGIVSGYLHTPAPPVLYKITDPVEVVKVGVQKTGEWTGMLVMGIVRLVQGDVSVKNIGGILTIGRFAFHSFEAGLTHFLKMMAIISLNLFIINLLPVPVLDGGHLVFYTIEAIKGAPLSLRKVEMAQQVGLVILVSLMIFSFYNDINNLFFSGW